MGHDALATACAAWRFFALFCALHSFSILRAAVSMKGLQAGHAMLTQPCLCGQGSSHAQATCRTRPSSPWLLYAQPGHAVKYNRGMAELCRSSTFFHSSSIPSADCSLQPGLHTVLSGANPATKLHSSPAMQEPIVIMLRV